jgi:hypothetical protein
MINLDESFIGKFFKSEWMKRTEYISYVMEFDNSSCDYTVLFLNSSNYIETNNVLRYTDESPLPLTKDEVEKVIHLFKEYDSSVGDNIEIHKISRVNKLFNRV